MPRRPEDKHKVQAPSLPEIIAAFDELHGALRSRVRYQGSVLTRGAMVNAIIIDFLSLDAESQRRIIEAGVARYEEMLASDEEVEGWQFARQPVERSTQPGPTVHDVPADPAGAFAGLRHVGATDQARHRGGMPERAKG